MPETTPPPDRVAARVASCECGGLVLHVSVDPVHVHGCTCTRCQRSTGSVMKLSAWFPETGVRITGPYTTWHYTGTDDPALTACFCHLRRRALLPHWRLP